MGQFMCTCLGCGEVVLADSEVEAEVVADSMAEDGCDVCGDRHGGEIGEWE